MTIDLRKAEVEEKWRETADNGERRKTSQNQLYS